MGLMGMGLVIAFILVGGATLLISCTTAERKEMIEIAKELKGVATEAAKTAGSIAKDAAQKVGKKAVKSANKLHNKLREKEKKEKKKNSENEK